MAGLWNRAEAPDPLSSLPAVPALRTTLSLSLALTALLGLVACGSGDDDDATGVPLGLRR